MKYLCAADPAAFETFLDARLAEHNERERNAAYRYERVPADDGLTAVRVYRGRDYDLIAVMETAVEDGYLTIDVQMEDVPACVSRAQEAGADEETASPLAPRIAAYLTKLIVLSVFLWASVWGISYLLGNRNPWLPLIVPTCYLLFFAVSRCIQYRPRDAKGDFAAFLENDLAATPCLAEADEDLTDATDGEDTASEIAGARDVADTVSSASSQDGEDRTGE